MSEFSAVNLNKNKLRLEEIIMMSTNLDFDGGSLLKQQYTDRLLAPLLIQCGGN